MKVAVLGLGPVGSSIADAIRETGGSELLVRDKNKKALRGMKNSSVDELMEAECLFICVSDDSSDEALREIGDFRNDIVLLSASSKMAKVKKIIRKAESISLFHPIQSFPRKSRVKSEFKDFYATLECTKTNRFLTDFAKKRNIKVIKLKRGTDRSLYHLSAMMAGNYTSLLLLIAERLLRESTQNEKLDGRVFIPMLEKIVERASADGIKDVITGPSARGDVKRIKEIAEAVSDREIKKLFLLLDRTTRRMCRDE